MLIITFYDFFLVNLTVVPVSSYRWCEDRIGVNEVFKITKFEQNLHQLVTSESIRYLHKQLLHFITLFFITLSHAHLRWAYQQH